MLEVRGLSKSWPRFTLELGLRLGEGEIAAVLGPSGCGKSTLLRLIAGLERPDSGAFILDGRDITGLAPERRGIGMVFQDYALFPHMSVRRNIEYGPRMAGVPRAQRRKAALALASSFEITQLLDRGPYSLSGGEQQRVALARALASRPAIILLDEPLSSLDASLRRRLRAEIAYTLRGAGMSAILVTHDAEEAFAVADRIYLMRSGRIEAEGRPEELYERPPTAWSAAFLGRGPLLKILSLEEGSARADESSAGGPAILARTEFGPFLCATGAGKAQRPAGGEFRSASGSLFFPADSPRATSVRPRSAGVPVAQSLAGAESGAPNRLCGKVVSNSFAGRYRRVALELPLIEGPDAGGSSIIEVELPSSVLLSVGDRIALDIPSESCLILDDKEDQAQ